MNIKKILFLILFTIVWTDSARAEEMILTHIVPKCDIYIRNGNDGLAIATVDGTAYLLVPHELRQLKGVAVQHMVVDLPTGVSVWSVVNDAKLPAAPRATRFVFNIDSTTGMVFANILQTEVGMSIRVYGPGNLAIPSTLNGESSLSGPISPSPYGHGSMMFGNFFNIPPGSVAVVETSAPIGLVAASLVKGVWRAEVVSN